jgi:exodeoxyribonuclease V beta subunit
LLQRSEFGGSIDRAWWRWSFTGLTRDRDETASDIGGLKDDEPGDAAAEIPAGDPLPLGSIRGGLEFGTMIHGVFEHTDFAAADPSGAIAQLVAEGAQWHGLDLDVPVVAAGLASAIGTPLGSQFDDVRLADIDRAHRLDEMYFAIGTPLGSQFDDVRLADIDRAHRLDEMYFDFPIDAPSGAPIALADIGAALATHLPDHDLLQPYAARVGEIGPEGFHGFLTGAIDLTLALPDTNGGRRWWVADYKTNRLPALGDIPTTSDYSRSAMAGAMIRSDYVLQALLYQVALHRYLKFRLPGYDPHTDLGGAMYLFVRGMVGADTPVIDGGRTGVFVWGPHPDLVLDVDRLFGAAP